jgi:DNA-binding transcriptional MocR family regulator
MDFSSSRILHTFTHDIEWRKACAELARKVEQPWVNASRPMIGLERHREAGAAFIQSLNLQVGPETLIVTNGGEHAKFIALASVANHGDTVLTEALTDRELIGAATILGITLKAVEIDEYGIRPEHFEEMCRAQRITALACTPTLHKPTGSIMSNDRRRSIACIAERYSVYLIEDDVHGPLAQPTHTPISSLIPDLSLYMTAMTECVLTSLRIGFLSVPRRLASRAESVLRVTSRMAQPALAEIASEWIFNGTAARLINIQRKQLSVRHAILGGVLGQYLAGINREGLSVWLSVPDYWQVNRLVAERNKRDIAVTSPNPFSVSGKDVPSNIRVCIGTEAGDDVYRSALETIAGVFDQYPQLHDFV